MLPERHPTPSPPLPLFSNYDVNYPVNLKKPITSIVCLLLMQGGSETIK
jgi:hypothetical protein